MQFKEGDVVRLKSGGPEMTVEQVGDQHMLPGKAAVFCMWFEMVGKQQVVKRDTFPPAKLEVVDYNAETISLANTYF